MASEDNVSRVQFASIVKSVVDKTREQGGDTVHMGTGERPTTGWMVSDADREHRVSAENFGTDHVVRYARRHEDALITPTAYMGTWRATGDDGARRPSDTVYLDVGRRHATPEDALETAEAHEQLAVYDLDRRPRLGLPVGEVSGKEWSTPDLKRALSPTQRNKRRG